ncbi:hypothetical protein B0H14DRAFT_2605041 [Mycena olivaceomarginata]|nr:hypothetical protein B0H14DRAFT_2605041 [Mycena olivaceomarginata]
MKVGWHGGVHRVALSGSEYWRKGAGQPMGQGMMRGDPGMRCKQEQGGSSWAGIVCLDTVAEVWENGAGWGQKTSCDAIKGSLRGNHGKRSKHILASMCLGELYSLWGQFSLTKYDFDMGRYLSPRYWFQGLDLSREVSDMAETLWCKKNQVEQRKLEIRGIVCKMYEIPGLAGLKSRARDLFGGKIYVVLRGLFDRDYQQEEEQR